MAKYNYKVIQYWKLIWSFVDIRNGDAAVCELKIRRKKLHGCMRRGKVSGETHLWSTGVHNRRATSIISRILIQAPQLGATCSPHTSPLKNTRREFPGGPKRSKNGERREQDECHDRREEEEEERKKNNTKRQNMCRERKLDQVGERERHILIQTCPIFIKVWSTFTIGGHTSVDYFMCFFLTYKIKAHYNENIAVKININIAPHNWFVLNL